jgi:pilus assembly protein Flp/PilA
MVNALKIARIFLSDCRGASAAEYALLLSVVGALLAMSAFVLGDTIAGSMDNTSDLFDQAGCNNNGQGTGGGGGNGGGSGQGAGNGSGNTC